MQYLNNFDYTVVIVYFVILVGLGLYLRKKASASLEDYFLGGRQLPWWALGISGMASFLDITGTMIITSFLFLLGPRGLFIEFRGGAVLVLAVMLAFAGKWNRRSGCMTGAEWLVYRFGEGGGGQLARIISVIANSIWTIGEIAYLVKGVGLFFSMFVPFSPMECSAALIIIATLYTMASGFYGVVYTDLFQSAIIIAAVIGISAMAMMEIADYGGIAAVATEVTGNHQWMNASPAWQTQMPKGYEAYECLVMVAFFYMVKNVLHGLGSGDDPKFFGAKNDRECGKLAFVWTNLMMFRWPMMMGFAVLGIFLVHKQFPDQGVLQKSADLIQTHVGAVDQAMWHEQLADIINHPDQYSPGLIDGLKDNLGESWRTKLNLVSYEGTVEPERILPAVIMMRVAPGFRGMLLVALIAASMSSFDSKVNRSAGFFTRDVYQRYLRPAAGNKELIWATYAFGIFMVGVGYLFAYTAKSINDIWGWITMSLTVGMMVPLMIKFYWWRYNPVGFAVGTVIGMGSAIVQRIYWPDIGELNQFFIIGSISLVAVIVGTFISRPPDKRTLEHFYRTTRPFGLWGPFKRTLPEDIRQKTHKEHVSDMIALPFVLFWQITLFLLPMLVIVQAWRALLGTAVVFVICILGMYIFWYRNLPTPQEEKELEERLGRLSKVPTEERISVAQTPCGD